LSGEERRFFVRNRADKSRSSKLGVFSARPVLILP
jgi:hypothetical protein